MHSFNAVLCSLVACALIWLILHPLVQDGVVIKVGLSVIALGFGAAALCLAGGAATVDTLGRSLAMISSGMGVCCAGYAWRRWKCGGERRRVADWRMG